RGARNDHPEDLAGVLSSASPERAPPARPVRCLRTLAYRAHQPDADCPEQLRLRPFGEGAVAGWRPPFRGGNGGALLPGTSWSGRTEPGLLSHALQGGGTGDSGRALASAVGPHHSSRSRLRRTGRLAPSGAPSLLAPDGWDGTRRAGRGNSGGVVR